MNATFDVGAFLDRQKFGPVQLAVLLVCILVMAVDGYDVFVVAFILPALAHDFGVTPAALTGVLVIQQFGLALGTYAIGPISDRFGRRRVLLLSLGIFGLLTIAATRATGVTELATLRFLAGLFFSGVIPNAMSLATEICPSRMRARVVTLVYCGYSGGSALGGVVVALLLQRYGWQSAFWVGGLVPLALVPVLLMVLPESLRFQVERNDRDPAVGRLLRRLDDRVTLTGDERFVLGEAVATGTPVAGLFRDGRAAGTLLLWLGFLASFIVINVLGLWLPTFYRVLGGLSLERAGVLTSFYTLSGLAGMVLCGILIDRFGAARVLTGFFACSAVAVVALGTIDLASPLLYAALCAAGICVIGGQGGLNALSTMLYPTRMRATGVGWAFGAGRIGAMIGPSFGGYMLAQHWTLTPIFTAIAMASVVAGASMVGLMLAERQRPAPLVIEKRAVGSA